MRTSLVHRLNVRWLARSIDPSSPPWFAARRGELASHAGGRDPRGEEPRLILRASGTLPGESDRVGPAHADGRSRAAANLLPARAPEAGRAARWGAGRRVLVLVQNQSLPGDRRVWEECLTLRGAGFEVVGVCPASANFPHSLSHVGGIEIHRFPMRPASSGALSYLR